MEKILKRVCPPIDRFLEGMSKRGKRTKNEKSIQKREDILTEWRRLLYYSQIKNKLYLYGQENYR